ncbi:chromosome transmission fidelity protein 18 homolog [Copidosoma floridanum]|uniref:chromosome transmission fidelity protein 18 homolog n=1 Tax=Copidosoma floridanum TaxID=29053 RepID=UPI0006C95766|nr:chromosome transmission fidelity protein 18 homolog [Copidosoma floridanum]
MDGDFPDPDEEFDLLHEDEYEVLRELETAEVQKTVATSISQHQQEQPENDQIHVNSDKETEKVDLVQEQDKDWFSINEEDIISQSVVTSKRSIDKITQDLNIPRDAFESLNFTDIDQFTSPKKKRPCWDQPEEIIKTILERRKNIHYEEQSTGKKAIQNKFSNNITKRIPMYNFVAVTHIDDGERFYIKVSNKNNFEPINHRPTSNSLIKSFDQLKEEAENILQQKAEKANLAAMENSEITESTSCELWVDKYRPHRYLDLLSDESINYSFLSWLKLWDKIVFDRDPTVRPKRPEANPKFKSKLKKKQEDVPDHDSDGFSTRRIALISGPPGLGKTTLAHVATRHAGYNVVEINASDERGPEAFREALLSSTQMRAVIDKEKRPNCLVLDEVDGAPAASIELLMKFIHGKLAPKGRSMKEKVDKKSKGCRRPIVCICNDLYAPSLRPLRSIALVISVPEITPTALAERLAKIMSEEGLRVDMRILIHLAERSACDVRACLGLLQYTGGGAKMLQNIAFGLKDMKKGLFDSWKEMLHVPMGKLTTSKERVQKIMKLTHQVETERLAQGVFHNYPTTCKEQIIPVYKSLQWFEFYDEVNTLVMQHQTWMLMPYANSAVVAWHLYLAASQVPKITYPTIQFEVNQKIERNKAILMVTKKSSKIDVLTLVSDVLPYLPDILTPRLRPVNLLLYSPKEKLELEKLINVMLDFGLAFTQIKKPMGGYEYVLDPNLWDLGTFPECKVRKTIPYTVKQIIIQELETTRIQRAAIATGDPTASGAGGGKATGQAKASSSAAKSSADQPKGQEDVPNHLKQLSVQPISEKKNRNFFATFKLIGQEKHKKQLEEEKALGIVNTKELEKIENAKAEKKQKKLFRNNVWFEYKEGYSNAVRRTILMKDLL